MAGGDEHAGLSHNAAPLLPGRTVKKIALFADVQNLYYTVRQAHGCHFHYAELWRQVAAQGEIVEARAYAIDRGDAKQRQFQQILRNLGVQRMRLMGNQRRMPSMVGYELEVVGFLTADGTRLDPSN